jgi:hypothetical protein
VAAERAKAEEAEFMELERQRAIELRDRDARERAAAAQRVVRVARLCPQNAHGNRYGLVHLPYQTTPPLSHLCLLVCDSQIVQKEQRQAQIAEKARLKAAEEAETRDAESRALRAAAEEARVWLATRRNHSAVTVT